MTWEKLSGNLVEGDVVEWTEAIWPPNRNRRKKSRPWGKQKVTAQVTIIEGDFVKLNVLKSAVIENLIGSELKPHKIGTFLTKKRVTLLHGDSRRLCWSEEAVRNALLDF